LVAGFLPVVVLQETGALAGEAPADAALFITGGSLAAPIWVMIARDLLL